MEATVSYLLTLQKFKAKDSEIKIKKHPLCLGNISGDISANNLKKKKTKTKTGINGCVYHFSVDYRAFDTGNIITIHKYLMKKHNIK